MSIKIVISDITTMNVDAIVNAANSQLIPGGGVDGAIHRVAGEGLWEELRNGQRFLAPGDAIITGGYDLPARHVIHTVAPFWMGGASDEDKTLARCYENSINLAFDCDLNSIAFPALGTGAFGIPREIGAGVALNVISAKRFDFNALRNLFICCYSAEDLEIYKHAAMELGLLVDGEGNLIDPNDPVKCPKCSHQLKPIVYGMLSSAELESSGLIYSAGCVIQQPAPDLGCSNCDWTGFSAGRGLLFR